MLTARILAPADYGQLAETEAAAMVPHLTDAAKVIVVERAGQIVACHVLQPILHAEGLWVHPDFRKRSSVGRRLWTLVRQTARTHFGVNWFCTGAASDEVRGLLDHLGAVKLPEHYMVPIGDR